MNFDRASMESALKAICLPHLRKMGFKGSFPNLYRDSDGFVSLVNFQFFSSGGSFCVNIAFADRQRRNVHFNKSAAPRDLRESHIHPRSSARLGSENLSGDHWFSFGQTSYGEVRGPARDPEVIASEINRLMSETAEPWWAKHAGGS